MSEEPKTAEEKVEKVLTELDMYMKLHSLPSPEGRVIDHYLNMKRSELAELSAEELAEIQYEIATYAYYLQDLADQKQVKFNACQNLIEKCVGHKLGEYGHIYNNKDKWYAAIYDHDAAREAYELQTHVALVIARTNFLSKKLEGVSNAILNLYKLRSK